jgi:LuxR family maltose regulon positive regulatory protein
VRQAEEAELATPPGRRIIERPRLLKLLDETEARTVLLIAPAGYGKTTLARQWLSGQRGVAWHAATAASRDVVVLARGIAEAAAAVSGSSPALFNEFLVTVKNPVRNVHRIAKTLAEATTCSNLRLLAIDDYQLLIGSPQAEEIIDFLCTHTRLRILITSRRRPSWASARDVIYGETYELTRADLKMTPEESQEVFRGVPSELVKKLTDQARGWPAVLGLAALTGTAPPEESLPSLYDFFADELWKTAEPALQDALTTLALLPTLDPELVEGSLGEHAARILEASDRLGVISKAEDDDRYELHPLLRDFLITKMHQQPAVEERVTRAIELALAHRSWDTALVLAQSFPALNVIDRVYSTVYMPMLRSGRIATLVDFAERARHSPLVISPSLDLVDADLALRDGDNVRAEQIALRIARQLGNRHPLSSHAYTLAGHAAFALWDAHRARKHFEIARQIALSDADTGEAVWGIALTATYGETGRLDEAARALESRRDLSSIDFVRYATARAAAALRAQTGLHELVDMEDALYVARRLEDPVARTSFLTSYAYAKGLRSYYDSALGAAREILHDAQAFALGFVIPHAYWDMAFAYLGLRLFSECDKTLQRVEGYAAATHDPHHVLNTRCLRARLCLTTGQLDRAMDEVTYDPPATPTRNMLQEFLATRALVHAVRSEDEKSCSALAENDDAGTVEARTLSAMARAVLAARRGDAASVLQAVAVCDRLDTWDSFVCAVRAEPQVLQLAVSDSRVRSQVEHVLVRSRDVALARLVGIQLKLPIGTQTALLSPRESEVFELLKKGLTNRQIGQALFISEATAKVHVRHVMEKLNAKTRTEAASRVTG